MDCQLQMLPRFSDRPQSESLLEAEKLAPTYPPGDDDDEEVEQDEEEESEDDETKMMMTVMVIRGMFQTLCCFSKAVIFSSSSLFFTSSSFQRLVSIAGDTWLSPETKRSPQQLLLFTCTVAAKCAHVKYRELLKWAS